MTSPLLSLLSNEPEGETPWRLSNVLPLLFPDLWLHVRCVEARVVHLHPVKQPILLWPDLKHFLQMSSAMDPPFTASITCSAETRLLDNDWYLCLWIDPQQSLKTNLMLFRQIRTKKVGFTYRMEVLLWEALIQERTREAGKRTKEAG